MNTAQTTKNLAQKIAKQIAQEPLEILKDVKEQVVGEVRSPSQHPPRNEDQERINEHNEKIAQDNLKSGRRMEALDRELKDISRDNLFKELQKKISEGQEVFIEEQNELSMEQKQVLKAQQEAFKNQKLNVENQSKTISLFGSSKPGRKLGQKQQAQKEQTRVEKPVPPSG